MVLHCLVWLLGDAYAKCLSAYEKKVSVSHRLGRNLMNNVPPWQASQFEEDCFENRCRFQNNPPKKVARMGPWTEPTSTNTTEFAPTCRMVLFVLIISYNMYLFRASLCRFFAAVRYCNCEAAVRIINMPCTRTKILCFGTTPILGRLGMIFAINHLLGFTCLAVWGGLWWSLPHLQTLGINHDRRVWWAHLARTGPALSTNLSGGPGGTVTVIWTHRIDCLKSSQGLRRDEKSTVILCRYFGQPTRQQLLGVKTNRRGDAGFSSRAKPGPGHTLMPQSFRDVATQTNDFTLRRTSEISDYFWYCLLSRPGLSQLNCRLTCTAQTQYHAMV